MVGYIRKAPVVDKKTTRGEMDERERIVEVNDQDRDKLGHDVASFTWQNS